MQHLAPRFKNQGQSVFKTTFVRAQGELLPLGESGFSMKELGCAVLLILWTCCGAKAPCGKPVNRDREEPTSQMKDEYNDGEIVQFSCRPGYIKQGRLQYKCEDGVWKQIGTVRCREKPCGYPGDIEFGTFELTEAEEFVFGARVNYKCDDGYQMISRLTYRDCTATGWSNSVPFCEPRKCVQFPAPKEGRIIATGTHDVDDEISVGHVLRFECYSPQSRPVPNEVYCTAKGEWSSEIVECKEISCPEPAIPDGRIINSKPVFKKNERLAFNCEKGYKYEGRDPECTEEGWNPQPSCKKIECYYQAVVNGDMVPKREKYNEDDTVDLYCNAGFVAMFKDRKPTCTRDGWVPPLTCESKRCDYPEIENGRLSYWSSLYQFPTRTGRSIDYYCNSGYATESGHEYGGVICTDYGWSPTPRCLRACELRYFNNMNMLYDKSRYTEGQTASFRCYDGFSTEEGQEAGTVECLSNGQFSKATCISTCKMILTVAIKSYKPQKEFFNVEDAVQYECKDGYHSNQGNIVDTSECRNGRWTYEPQCKETRCSLDDYNGQKRSFKNGDVAKLKCEEGFELYGSEKVQCYYFGWYPELPLCGETSCMSCASEKPIFDRSELAVGKGMECLQPPKLKTIEEQQMKPEYKHGETVTYNCKNNYVLYGSKTITCENGRWTSPPQCIERRRCNFPPQTSNGEPLLPPNKRDFYSDDTATYHCNLGYRITGSNESTCIGGRWTAAPKCTERPCKVPSINHGSVVELRAQYVPGATVQFKCEAGNKLNSVRPSRCSKGEWDFLPNCITTSCGAAPTVKDGEFVENPKESYHSGERVTYRCKKGFVFKKLSHVTCEDSQWTETPECKKEGSRCGAAPFVAYGDITDSPKTSYPSGTTVEYRCQSYYKMLGNNKVTCTSGAWSTLPECLEPCTAGEEEMAENNIKLRWLSDAKLYSANEDEIEFICLSNDYIKHEESTPFRVKCIRGKLLYPRCIRKGSCTPSSKEMDPRNIILMNENTEIRDGNQVEFTCKPGFYKKLNQNMNVMCMKGKLDYPICDDTPPVCSRPPPIPHGTIVGDVKNEYNPGTSIEYKCNEDYVLEGTRMLTCIGGGWSVNVPQCIQPCRLTADDINENNLELYQPEALSQAVTHKTSIGFNCKEGYINKISSPLFGQCNNGIITYPSCVIDSPCQVTKDKLDEHFVELSRKNKDKTAFFKDETISFTCKPRFKVLTPPGILVANCTEAGFIYPTCYNPDPCRVSEDGTDLNNLELEGEKILFRHGDIIPFKCKNGFFEITSLSGTCKNSNITYPTCVPGRPCKVQQNEIDEKNIELHPDFANLQYVMNSKTITFRCKEGYVKHSTSSDLSQVCEEGIIAYPSCIRKSSRIAS